MHGTGFLNYSRSTKSSWETEVQSLVSVNLVSTYSEFVFCSDGFLLVEENILVPTISDRVFDFIGVRSKPQVC